MNRRLDRVASLPASRNLRREKILAGLYFKDALAAPWSSPTGLNDDSGSSAVETQGGGLQTTIGATRLVYCWQAGFSVDMSLPTRYVRFRYYVPDHTGTITAITPFLFSNYLEAQAMAKTGHSVTTGWHDYIWTPSAFNVGSVSLANVTGGGLYFNPGSSDAAPIVNSIELIEATDVGYLMWVFDDNNVSALSLLERYGWRGTVGITSGATTDFPAYRAWATLGHCFINHGQAHIDWSTETNDTLREADIVDGKATMVAQGLGENSDIWLVPYGKWMQSEASHNIMFKHNRCVLPFAVDPQYGTKMWQPAAPGSWLFSGSPHGTAVIPRQFASPSIGTTAEIDALVSYRKVMATAIHGSVSLANIQTMCDYVKAKENQKLLKVCTVAEYLDGY